MFHTVPVNVNAEHGKKKYVTVAFGIGDDLKATVSDPANLRLGDRTLASRGVSTALNFTDESGKAAFSQKNFHKLLLPQYRAEKKSWYVVARNFFLLLLNFSAWPCLGAA